MNKIETGNYYFISSTKSGKVIAQHGKECEIIKFSEMWIRESPYYDINDPIIIEKITVDPDGFKITKNIIKEY